MPASSRQSGSVRRRIASWELEATSTGSHCGGQATGLLSSASLLATQGFVTKVAQKAAATPIRTTARMLEASLDLR